MNVRPNPLPVRPNPPKSEEVELTRTDSKKSDHLFQIPECTVTLIDSTTDMNHGHVIT